MANNTNHSYTIDLDVKSTESSKRALKELQTTFTNSNNSARELNKAYIRIASNIQDCTELDKQYSKVIDNRIKDREKEIDKIKSIQIGIINNTKLSEEQRKNLLDNTKKRIDLAQQEIDSLNKANIVKIKNMQKEMQIKAQEAQLQAKLDAEKLKALKEEEARRKKLSTYIKADLNTLKEKIKQQFAFIKMLKTTEGRYQALKKAASTAVKIGGKVAGAGLKVGAGAAGMAVAVGGMAVAGAEKTEQKAQAMRSLKSGVRESVLDSIYVKTGADYSVIVDAINRIYGLVNSDRQVEKFAIAEIQNPGLGRLLAMQGHVDNNFDYQNAMNQIRKNTGIQDTSEIIESASNSRLVKNGEISQFDHMNAMASLMQVGIDSETAERIITHVARNKGSQSFIDAFNSTDLSKLVYDKGTKNALKNANIELKEIDYNKKGLEETPEQKAARESAEQLRKFELEKDRMLSKILPGVLPLMRVIMDLARKIMPKILSVLGHLLEGLSVVVQWVENKLDIGSKFSRALGEASFTITNAAKQMEDAYAMDEPTSEDNMRRIAYNKMRLQQLKKENELLADTQKIQGGSISNTAIVDGVEQPKLIIPLNPSAVDRANQIVNNFTTSQTFNMVANQTTPLAFASAVGQNRFVQRTKVF